MNNEVNGLITISIDEYKELLKRGTVLELLFIQARAAKYSSEVEAAVSAAMVLMSEPSLKDEGVAEEC